MKLFGINIGKQTDEGKSPSADTSSIKANLDKYSAMASKHQAIIITLLVVAVLGLTSLQMLRFTNPSADEARVQENITKLKRIKIDDNVIDQIKSLQASNATAAPNVDEGRTNPFDE